MTRFNKKRKDLSTDSHQGINYVVLQRFFNLVETEVIKQQKDLFKKAPDKRYLHRSYDFPFESLKKVYENYEQDLHKRNCKDCLVN